MVCLAAGAGLFAPATHAQSADPADQVCPRSPSGTVLQDPPQPAQPERRARSHFQFKTIVDLQGLTRYCFVSDAGLEAPTLHVSPGDQLIIHLQNTLAAPRRRRRRYPSCTRRGGARQPQQ